jgi:hypothetical protein
MRRLRAALAIVALAAALVPELPRYAAERRLYQAGALIRLVVARPRAVSDPGRALEHVTMAAAAAARDLPGDPRPPMLEGAARLLARQPEQALARYRDAWALGERPEIAVNLGRAYALLGRPGDARAAYLRAGWASPAVLASLPPAVQALLHAELAEREANLRAGRLTAPPPLPPADRP